MVKTRVLLAEDHTIVRKGLHALLDDEAEIEVVGEACDGREAVDMAAQLRPDVVLMDITMPALNGLEATRQIKERFPEIRVLVLTRHSDKEYIYQILRAGGSGYVVKQAAPEELIAAIWAVCRGETYLSPSISAATVQEYIRQAERTIEGDRYGRLTPREREVLQLIAEGHSTQEIASILCISVKTARTHRRHLMEKLDLHSEAELALYAVRRGVISLDS